MSEKNNTSVRTWIEIDRKAIFHNYLQFRNVINSTTKIAVVIKSNAYGHDIVPFAHEMQKNGADWLVVDSFVEAKALREKGISLPILVLGYTLPENYDEASKEKISITISNQEVLELLVNKRFDIPLQIHIKVDTGMHRQGFMDEEISQVLDIVEKLGKYVEVEGLYTHFSSAKNPDDTAHTIMQLERFIIWKEHFSDIGYTPLIHASATGASLLFPEAHFDMVRIGIGIYGLWPSKEVEKHVQNKINLQPVLTWKTVVGEVKIVPTGSAIGYDGITIVDKKTSIAILPVGYWHGYSRSLGDVGSVLMQGKKVRVLGRISMDMVVVDISTLDGISRGDEVVLLGKQSGGEVSATEFADRADTVHYEILTRLNPKIKRVYKKKSFIVVNYEADFSWKILKTIPFYVVFLHHLSGE